jgi:hypothetical protein
LRVTDVQTILVTAPWKGDPFWALDEKWGADREFSRTASLIEVATGAGLIVHTRAAIGPGPMANLHVAFASANARFVEYAVAPDNVPPGSYEYA